MKLLPSTPTLGKPWPEGEEHASPKCITSIRCTKTAWLYLDPSLTAYSNFNNLGSINFLMTAFSNFNNFFNFRSTVSVMVISTMVMVVSASPVSAVPVLPLLVLSQGIAVNAYSGSQQELGADAGANPTVGWVGPVGALALAAALLTAVCIARKHVCIARKRTAAARKHVCIARKRTAAVKPTDEPLGSPPATPPNGPPSPAPLHEVPLSSLPCVPVQPTLTTTTYPVPMRPRYPWTLLSCTVGRLALTWQRAGRPQSPDWQNHQHCNRRSGCR